MRIDEIASISEFSEEDIGTRPATLKITRVSEGVVQGAMDYGAKFVHSTTGLLANETKNM